MKKHVKKAISLLLCVLLVCAFAACGKKAKAPVDLFAKIDSMKATQEALALPDVKTPLDTLEGGKVDPALVGTWKMASGIELTYTFAENGISTAEVGNNGVPTEVPFTCIVRNERNILCQEAPVMNYNEAGEATEGEKALTYTSYQVDGDVLYLLSVESHDEFSSSYYGSLQRLYRADENGSIDSAVAENPIDISSFYGEWTGEKGGIVIDQNGLTLNGDVYTLSLNDKQQLVAEKDGVSTAYTFAAAESKDAANEERTEWNESRTLVLVYEGADENDKPNLLACMTDWAAEFGGEDYRYDVSFTMPVSAS